MQIYLRLNYRIKVGLFLVDEKKFNLEFESLYFLKSDVFAKT